jgi:hypothetical protein
MSQEKYEQRNYPLTQSDADAEKVLAVVMNRLDELLTRYRNEPTGNRFNTLRDIIDLLVQGLTEASKAGRGEVSQ